MNCLFKTQVSHVSSKHPAKVQYLIYNILLKVHKVVVHKVVNFVFYIIHLTKAVYLFISKAISPITFTSLSSWMLLKSTTESFPSHFTRRVPYCESSTVKWLFPFANESVGNQQRHSRNSTATEILLFIIIFYF